MRSITACALDYYYKVAAMQVWYGNAQYQICIKFIPAVGRAQAYTHQPRRDGFLFVWNGRRRANFHVFDVSRRRRRAAEAKKPRAVLL
jgi:hypothetical protein